MVGIGSEQGGDTGRIGILRSNGMEKWEVYGGDRLLSRSGAIGTAECARDFGGCTVGIGSNDIRVRYGYQAIRGG